MIQTTTLMTAIQPSCAKRDSTPSSSPTKDASPRTTTSTAAPMSSSGTTSATLLIVEATTAPMKRVR